VTGQMPVQYLKMSHDHFLPDSFPWKCFV